MRNSLNSQKLWITCSLWTSDDISARVKRFLVLHGDELAKSILSFIKYFVKQLGRNVRRSNHSQTRKFLADLARQPVPLYVSAFAKGLLSEDDISRIPSYLEGLEWRELHEALIFDNEGKGKRLWSIMKRVNHQNMLVIIHHN